MINENLEDRSVVSGPDRFAIKGDYLNGYIAGPVRSESSVPITFRFAQYPDGRKVLQGGYQWTKGFDGGIAWRDLHCVMVDADGQEIV